MDNNQMFDKELTDNEIEAMKEDANNFISGLKEEVEAAGIDINNISESDTTSNDLLVKNMNVIIDPATGENKILGSDEDAYPVSELKDSFDEMVKKINEDTDMDFIDDRPISEQEAIDYLANNDNEVLLKELNNGTDISLDATRGLLEIVNRKIKGEKFNTYKELPEEIKLIIDRYVNANGGIPGATVAQINMIKKNAADALLDEFITDIQLDRAKNDFARDLEQLYQTSSKEISDASLEYIDERNKAYREAANEIEDEGKKKRLLDILDRIDEARALTELKEFAKRCKIKPIELEKPERKCYDGFLYKYKNSSNNIYDINLARTVLLRHIGNDGFTQRDVDAFFIAFCKQVSGYSVDIATEHAYMYYVLYYCALLDGDKSSTFVDNVKQVIENLRGRNPIINK